MNRKRKAQPNYKEPFSPGRSCCWWFQPSQVLGELSLKYGTEKLRGEKSVSQKTCKSPWPSPYLPGTFRGRLPLWGNSRGAKSEAEEISHVECSPEEGHDRCGGSTRNDSGHQSHPTQAFGKLELCQQMFCLSFCWFWWIFPSIEFQGDNIPCRNSYPKATLSQPNSPEALNLKSLMRSPTGLGSVVFSRMAQHTEVVR